MQKENAYNEMYHGIDQPNLEELSKRCTENEIIYLMDMYAHPRTLEKLSNIVSHQLLKIKIVNKEYDQDSIVFNLINKILLHVNKFAPNVRRYSSILDEEQERELEAELEEERQVEKPGLATAREPSVSEGLKRFIYTKGKDVTMLHTLSNGLMSTPYFNKVPGLFDSVSGSQPAIFISDFIHTINEDIHKTVYLKLPSWAIISKGSETFVIVSNYEAEHCALFNFKKDHCSGFASSNISNASSKTTLFALSPLTRLNQPKIFLSVSSVDLPIPVHLFAGSIHPDPELLVKCHNYLAICPRPLKDPEIWDQLFKNGLIDRDGFVSKKTVRK